MTDVLPAYHGTPPGTTSIGGGSTKNYCYLRFSPNLGAGGEGATQDPNSQYLPTKCRKSPKYLVLPNHIKELQIANSWSLGPGKKKHFPNLKNTKSCQHSEVKLFALDPSIATLDILILYRTNQQKFKAYIKERCIQRADFDLKFYGHEIVTL